MAGEIRKNVQLQANEEVLYWSAVEERTNWLWMQPGILQLTSHRLILLEHHALSSDWILEIPRSAIVNIRSHEDSGTDWTAVSYASGDAPKTFELRPLAWRGRPSGEQTGALSNALQAFHSGELSHSFIANSEKQHAAVEPPRYSTVSLLTLLYVVMLIRLGVYVAKFPGEWRAMEAYAASPDCNQRVLAARAELEQHDPKPAQASVRGGTSGFCAVQKMTVVYVWSARGQHVRLMDSRGKDYEDVGALNSVDANLWWRMQPGESVDVLLAGDQPAWIFHNGNLFETRGSPEHNFWEQSFLMVVLFLFCALMTACIALLLRSTILVRRHAVFAHAG